MIEVRISYNELAKANRKNIPELTEEAPYDVLIGLIVMRRLRVAGMPVVGLIGTVGVDHGVLTMHREGQTKDLMYRWYEDDSELRASVAKKKPVEVKDEDL